MRPEERSKVRQSLPGINELEEKLEVRSRAANAGEAQDIKPNDTAFDAGQTTIVGDMESLATEKWRESAQRLENHEKRRLEVSTELESLPRQGFAEAVEGSVQLVLRARDESLIRTQEAAEETALALNAFRVRLNVNRPAHYPEWRVMHWAIVVVLFFVESVANAQFFSKASTFGLLGGFLQAAIISATNIGVGLLAGMQVLPWRHMREMTRKPTTFASAVAILMGFFLFLFNLATAHYRVLLEDIPNRP
jgi:hypothetical protein